MFLINKLYDYIPLKGTKTFVKVSSTRNGKQPCGNYVTCLQFYVGYSQLIVTNRLIFINMNLYSSVIISLYAKSSRMSASQILNVVLRSVSASLGILNYP
jgi:hypothetical protein